MSSSHALEKMQYIGIQGNLPDSDQPFIGTFAKVFPKGKAYAADSVAFGTVRRIRQLVNGDTSYFLSGKRGGTYRMSEFDIILHSVENPEVRRRYGIGHRE